MMLLTKLAIGALLGVVIGVLVLFSGAGATMYRYLWPSDPPNVDPLSSFDLFVGLVVFTVLGAIICAVVLPGEDSV